ncbi:L-ascorbate metabolism protein UlaG (beta-lactamase superfamily) [Clostridium tetanomorphum]|uniref:MBL fold metallo-hydrolase n=1 Tax=Clostridium tetanomorphum TaxID=1553 RepID=UPI00044F59C2|nr:MBL fold metallo-hydrolase [Clostridium tetanomorphum]KAJ51989.1 metal dependent hydrolase [Clostridium tetanomorphum DSM 665]MBP1862909.1 L-ascorbate metabolism protein UlaG (beta-lactamase superfamily) [Clostridium tetanomorphum]NRS87046.1 L-ascorbate metabolism protein UlaG (beta-lactamase superfamily) [Clostridium tetanomorphum]SQC00147.1 metal dependent hydrolase [Clostridium tetanomorphum]
MNEIKAKIHYLYHDGFAVETTNHFLIFDYYYNTPMGEEMNLQNGVVGLDDIKNKKNIFVFSSHGHHDHFNPVILDWEKYNSEIKYILSSDITLPEYKNNYYTIWENKDLQLDDIYIKTFHSTDIGVAFLVKVDGLTIFHAGDLNWWNWKEDPIEERVKMELDFKKEITKLEGENINIAFFPVDPRLEEFSYLGGKYFIEKIHPEMFIPMHFWAKNSITKDFKNKILESSHEISTNIIEIFSRGQIINLT